MPILILINRNGVYISLLCSWGQTTEVAILFYGHEFNDIEIGTEPGNSKQNRLQLFIMQSWKFHWFNSL